jgi:hypothetical protein
MPPPTGLMEAGESVGSAPAMVLSVDPAPVLAGPPITRSEHLNQRRAERGPAPMTALKALGIAAVAVTSTAVGLLAFAVSAAITHGSASGAAVRFDTTWYYRIAQLGYLHRAPTSATDYGGLRVAFFPGLPLLERGVHDVVGGAPSHTTLLVGALCLLSSCLVLWYMVATEWDEQVAWRAVVLLAFFPGAYVFSMAYSEALAIPLALCTLWGLRRRWYLFAGLSAGLAGSVRLLSVMLVAACVVAAIREIRNPERSTSAIVRAVISPFLALTGLAAYLGYLKSTTGGFFTYSTAERLGWQNGFSLLAPFHNVRLFFQLGVHGPPATIINGIGVFVVVAAVILVATVSMALEFKVYGIGILLAWLFTTNTGAWFRFIEFAFPVLIALAVKVPNRILLPVIGACAASFGILIVLFASAVAFSP